MLTPQNQKLVLTSPVVQIKSLFSIFWKIVDPNASHNFNENRGDLETIGL